MKCNSAELPIMRKYYSASFRTVLVSSLVMWLAAASRAQQGVAIPFQGQLTNQTGEVISPRDPLSLVFRFYETPVGGAVMWEESHPNVAVIAGRFSVLLGSRT